MTLGVLLFGAACAPLPAELDGCPGGTYAFEGACIDRPTVRVLTSTDGLYVDAEGRVLRCADEGRQRVDDDYIRRFVLTGRPGAEVTVCARRFGCSEAQSPYVIISPPDVTPALGEDGAVAYDIEKPVGTCDPATVARFDVVIVVDGVRSAPESLVLYNSLCADAPNTCGVDAERFCAPGLPEVDPRPACPGAND
ncbi:MAG: hypothetical protein RIT81_17700 [Deltaproteobacteria bacterium]